MVNWFPNPISARLLLSLTICAFQSKQWRMEFAKDESYQSLVRVIWMSALKEHLDVKEAVGLNLQNWVEPHKTLQTHRDGWSCIICCQCKQPWCVSVSHRASLFPRLPFPLGWWEGWKGEHFHLLYPTTKFSSKQLTPGCHLLSLPALCGPGHLASPGLLRSDAFPETLQSSVFMLLSQVPGRILLWRQTWHWCFFGSRQFASSLSSLSELATPVSMSSHSSS